MGDVISLFGSFGFIGSSLANALEELGFIVNRPDRNNFVAPSYGFGTIIWSIGLTGDFRSRPFETVEAHISLLGRLLEQKRHTRVVYFSSTRLYGKQATGAPGELIFVNPQDASDLYNISKLAGESLVNSDGSENLILRLSNIVGPNEISRRTFIGSMIRGAKAGRFKLESSLESTKDYLWIDDATSQICSAIKHKFKGTINIASGNQLSNSSWLTGLQKIYDFEIVIDENAVDYSFPQLHLDRHLLELSPPRHDPIESMKLTLGGLK